MKTNLHQMKPLTKSQRKKLYLDDAIRYFNGTWKPKYPGWKVKDLREFQFIADCLITGTYSDEEKKALSIFALLFAREFCDDEYLQQIIKEEYCL